MAFYQLVKHQTINANIDEVWDFISSPRNLKVITPDHMGFDITSDCPEKMYSGLVISYDLRPLLGLRTTWVSEISHIKEKEYFVDEQKSGPYALWHHQHILKETDKGVIMTDIVSYKPPFGWLGALANTLFIKAKLEEIFAYRTAAVEQKFGKPHA